MPCDTPLDAYEHKTAKTDKGKAVVIVVHKGSAPNHPQNFNKVQIACGRCTGCRLERSRLWAARCMHEKLLHEDSYFVTLTYDDDNLPAHGSLRPRHLALFFKQLRKRQNVRFYACGEYGDSTDRPHYHAIIFGLRLDDMVFDSFSGENRLYTSKLLQRCWKRGKVWVGHVTFESCAYVARYILKKALGKTALRLWRDPKTDEHFYKDTGQLFEGKVPEFVRMSRKPGIGAGFLLKYQREIYGPLNDGTVTLPGGIRFGAPRFYDNMHEKVSPEVIARIREQRRLKAEASNLTPRNRRARRIMRDQRIQQLKRGFL